MLLWIGDIFFRLYFNPWHHTINEVFQRYFKGNLQNYDQITYLVLPRWYGLLDLNMTKIRRHLLSDLRRRKKLKHFWNSIYALKQSKRFCVYYYSILALKLRSTNFSKFHRKINCRKAINFSRHLIKLDSILPFSK